MSLHKILIVDDQPEKVRLIFNANEDKGSPLHFIQSPQILELLKNEDFRHDDFPQIFEKIIIEIQAALDNDPWIDIILLDLDLTGQGTVTPIYNYFIHMLKNEGKTLINCFAPRIPQIFAWTHHDLATSEQNKSDMPWDQLFAHHGFSSFFDGVIEQQNLIQSLQLKLRLIEDQRQQMRRQAFRQHAESIEMAPGIISFLNIHGFTSLFEKYPHDPGVVASLVNEIFDTSGTIQAEYGGVVHKYIGDSVMTYFPSKKCMYFDERYKNSMVSAVLAAIQIYDDINLKKKSRDPGHRVVWNDLDLQVNFGIAGGQHIMWGCFGYTHCKEFTLLGSPVIRAHRYQSSAGKGTYCSWR